MNNTETENADETNYYLWGILATVCASFFTVLGELLMKQAFSKKTSKCTLCSLNETWWFGFSLIILITTPIDMFALGIASASLIFPIGIACTIILNQVIAPRFFFKNIQLSKMDWFGTMLIVVGAIISSVFGDTNSNSYTKSELLALYRNNDFIIILSVMSVFAAAAFFCQCKKNKRIRFYSYVYIPAFFGGLQMISFKSLSELTLNALRDGEDSWNTVYPYIFIVTTLLLAFLQIISLNAGISRFSAISFFPAYNSAIMLIVVILGSIFFKEIESMQPVVFSIGLVLIICGVSLLSIKKEDLQSDLQSGLSNIELGE